MNGGPPFGILLRRLRSQRQLSQTELAHLCGVSQSLISYYERGLTRPSQDVLKKMEKVLELEPGTLADAADGVSQIWRDEEPGLELEPPRSGFLKTLEAISGRIAWFDQPANRDGGDLALALNLRSHTFVIVLDAVGSGPAAAVAARIAAGCAFGATVTPGGGIPSPEDVVEALVRFSRDLEITPRLAAVCVLAYEQRTATLRQCRLGLPPPYLRSGRVSRWTGKPEGPAGSYVGERRIETGDLLLLATDGVADLRTRTGKALWEASEMKTLLARARSPDDVIEALRRRAGEAGPATRRDDMFALVVTKLGQ